MEFVNIENQNLKAENLQYKKEIQQFKDQSEKMQSGTDQELPLDYEQELKQIAGYDYGWNKYPGCDQQEEGIPFQSTLIDRTRHILLLLAQHKKPLPALFPQPDGSMRLGWKDQYCTIYKTLQIIFDYPENTTDIIDLLTK